jgi:uncharacterized protein YdiU (UPF0061 family)
MPNPFLLLNYEPAIENLGGEYYDIVEAAQFPAQKLRFRNDEIMPILGHNPTSVRDDDFIEAFGFFQSVRPLLALRYHGYQFGYYNPNLGDGRGFLYGQVRGIDQALYDFGTKGSGQTPYSRNGDGRLTLKGGVREVLASEALYALGVNTSRCLSLIETGESLWRGDEPSPTRSSVMVRFSRSHVRFGTFERLHYLQRPDLIEKLLTHIIHCYYPQIAGEKDSFALFYTDLVQRVAQLCAQWMAAGFCHGVLNTDNMSITGESFDYGPYAFIPTFNPNFTAAYFDSNSRYSYGNQPYICHLNLEMLQVPLRMVIPKEDLEEGLTKFDSCYYQTYAGLMLNKLGLEGNIQSIDLVQKTIDLLLETQIGYHEFFSLLKCEFNLAWFEDSQNILENSNDTKGEIWHNWRVLYHHFLSLVPPTERDKIPQRLAQHNPSTALLRPVIESVWENITSDDNWDSFNNLVRVLQEKR